MLHEFPHTSSVVVPLRAQQTDIVDAYDILHRLGLRVELTQPTAVSSLIEPTVKLSPRAGARVARGSTVKITPQHGPIGSPAVLKSHPHYRLPEPTASSRSSRSREARSCRA